MFRLRSITNGFTFLRSLGYCKQFSTRLNTAKVTRIDLAVMEQLCLSLNCTPNDLLEWDPEENTVGSTTQLSQLQTKKIQRAEKLLNELSKEEIVRLFEHYDVTRKEG